MVQTNKIRAKMVELGLSVESLAKMLEMDRSTLYRKLKSPTRLSVGEVGKLSEALGLSEYEATKIFFS